MAFAGGGFLRGITYKHNFHDFLVIFPNYPKQLPNVLLIQLIRMIT